MSAANTRVNFALCWHMHQPWYQKGIEGDYMLPWVYLHAVKDYSDMAAHLETYPQMKVVVNFAPVLLEQLNDYVDQLQAWLEHGHRMRDPMLNLLAGWSNKTWRLSLEILNLLDSDDHDIDYYYASRLPGEPSAGIEDIHFHIFEPRQARLQGPWVC